MTTKEMREPTFLILTALAGGRKHGYALIAEADELSAHRVQLKVGTLYAALDRLAAEGLVEEAGDEVTDGRLRRYYALTEQGATALSEAAERSARIAAEAQTRLNRARNLPAFGAKVSAA
ncbi:PadR family transcriptional regulator [Microbacterium halophytorum]|uniref:PadR family transcriptional regulator n=1 Tax=Microbacterium halophytorum TaxID=2067568 RepID=UPI000CFA94B2|nr:PadR family transcriptional regulator [Microbacterium halophytorum]